MSIAGDKPQLHYAWIILIVSNLVVIGALGLARFSYSLLLPAMQTGLDMDNTQAGTLATADTIGYLTLSLIGGALASRYSPRGVVTAGLVLAGLGMLITGAAKGIFIAAVGRAITGVGSGASNVPIMGLLLGWFTQKRRGAASGIAVSGASIAIIAVSPLVPRIVEAYPDNGWRMRAWLHGEMWQLLSIHPLHEMRCNGGWCTNLALSGIWVECTSRSGFLTSST
jgi:MFS family permease